MSSEIELKKEFGEALEKAYVGSLEEQMKMFFDAIDLSNPKELDDARYRFDDRFRVLGKGLPTLQEGLRDAAARSKRLQQEVDDKKRRAMQPRNQALFEESFWRKISDDIKKGNANSAYLEKVENFYEDFSGLFTRKEQIDKIKADLRGRFLQERGEKMFDKAYLVMAEEIPKLLEADKYQGLRDVGSEVDFALDKKAYCFEKFDAFCEKQQIFKDINAAFDENEELVRHQHFLKDKVRVHAAAAHAQIFINALDESISEAEKSGAVMQQVVLKGTKEALEKSKQTMLALKFDDPEFDKKLNAEAEKVLDAGEKMQSDLKDLGFPGKLARAWNNVKSFFCSVLHIKTHRKLSKKEMGKAMVFGREKKFSSREKEREQIDKELSQPRIVVNLGKIKEQAEEIKSASTTKKKK